MPDPALVERFRNDLDALSAPGDRLGIAVSGGPDSLALLVLAAAARPGEVEAATVDHGLRPGSHAEAEMVAGVCATLDVPHVTLTVAWASPPATAIQEKARDERYRLLSGWLDERNLSALATAHHADDQAETLLMRLNRGSGVRGLAAMRPKALIPGSSKPLLRPLLGWRHAELEALCQSSGLTPVADPSNRDAQFERVRVRQALADAEWLDATGLARSAANLAAADEALEWAASAEWDRAAVPTDQDIVYRPSGAPPEIVRRIVARAVTTLATEGQAALVRGRELDPLIAALEAGRTATLRGVSCSGGGEWRFRKSPPRTTR